MTTLEASIKDNLQISNNHHAILYFPKLRSLTHSILTGKSDIIDSLTTHEADLSSLEQAYQKVTSDYPTQSPILVNASFSIDGIIFTASIKSDDDAINQIEFAELKWKEDTDKLVKIAYALCELTTQCMRTLPMLANNPKHFRNINNIDVNPIYDHVVFVYAMFLKLELHNSLLKSFIQMIPATRKVTYTMMIQTLKCGINFPQSLTNHYENKDSIMIRDSFVKNEEGTFEKDDGYQVCFSVVTYAGQKLFHKLQLIGSPKKEFTQSSRYMELESTLPMNE